MGRIIPYILENKKCLKPPTSYSLIFPTMAPSRLDLLCANWAIDLASVQAALVGIRYAGVPQNNAYSMGKTVVNPWISFFSEHFFKTHLYSVALQPHHIHLIPTRNIDSGQIVIIHWPEIRLLWDNSPYYPSLQWHYINIHYITFFGHQVYNSKEIAPSASVTTRKLTGPFRPESDATQIGFIVDLPIKKRYGFPVSPKI